MEHVKMTAQKIKMKVQVWEEIFKHMEFPPNRDETIPDEEFKDPYSRTVKAIFYLYSLESYLYGRLNWAARTKQQACVPNMGCFAAVLSKALAEATMHREDQIDA